MAGGMTKARLEMARECSTTGDQSGWLTTLVMGMTKARPEHVAADQAVEAVMEPGGSKETRQLDEVFQDGLDLHQLYKIGLHKQVMKIIDSHMIELGLEGNEPHQDIQVINTESRRGMCEESGKVEECISSIVEVGVGCSMSSPCERMNIKDVLKELLAAKKFYESR
ncbi:hypothetical protein Syun_030926 [Stephania yunnanensis]|uniref:Uncharacterized protein n=1 Tax=Stephania yunnanensis TaxID=152371 RepID=A0AAP0HCN1_9MAGN